MYVSSLSSSIITHHPVVDVIQEGLAYESNYGSGLRVVDVSSVTTDPTGGHFKEIAFFDGPSSFLLQSDLANSCCIRCPRQYTPKTTI